MGILQELISVGLNAFAAKLLAESLLRSQMAPLSADEPLTFFFPVKRDDCAGWSGVTITLEAVRAPAPESGETGAAIDAAKEG